MNGNKIHPTQVTGGVMGWFDDADFEKESLLSSITRGVVDVIEEVPKAVVDAFKTDPEYKLDPTKFPSQGSIEFNNNLAKVEEQQKQKEEADRKRRFNQALKEDYERAQRAKDKMLFEEEINDIATNLPTEEKNRLLHYQASYKDRSIYQRAALRAKLIEAARKAEKQQKEVSIPSPAKQPSALEGVFEGRSGTQGSGTANLSALATG